MNQPDRGKAGDTLGPVVAAAHLASGAMPALSELEFALVVQSNAFNRWIARCCEAAGGEGLSSMEVQILHAVNHRERDKTLAELCMMFNIEDTHVVSYALKKLQQQQLVQAGRRGKEKTVKITDYGSKLCESYRNVREKLLVDAILAMGISENRLSEVAMLLRVVSGLYDQAARAAASY